jgi:hypothetical protein
MSGKTYGPQATGLRYESPPESAQQAAEVQNMLKSFVKLNRNTWDTSSCGSEVRTFVFMVRRPMVGTRRPSRAFVDFRSPSFLRSW